MIDYMEKITELRQQRATLRDQGDALIMAGKYDELAPVQDQIDGLDTSIKALERQMQASGEQVPEAKDPENGKKAGTPYNSFGEQLMDIVKACRGKGVSDKLARVQDAQGNNEGTGTDGGFAVQSDFAGAILESAVQSSPLLSRLDSYTVSANANRATWLQADEGDVGSSVYGGVQMFWTQEGGSVSATKPQFRKMDIDLNKMMGVAYATDELLQDAAFMSGFFGTCFGLAADRLLTDAVINGDGVAKPLGILKSPALITQALETSQTAKLTGVNAVKMQSRLLTRNRQNCVWIMNPDVEPYLPQLSIDASSGNAAKMLWDPEGGLGNLSYQRILGKDVLFEDSCSSLGTKGDILLVDPSQYMLLRKGGAKQDWSMHVAFLTDEQCFRMVLRVGGAPKMSKAVTLKNTTAGRSAYVTLAGNRT